MTATINASTSSGVVTTADNSGVLQLQTASTAALTIDGSQNVGIGTSSPSTYANSYAPVLVTGTGNNWATIQGRADGPSGAGNGVSYGGSYSTNPINGARIFVAASGSAGQQGQILFFTKNTDDNTNQPTERMRIDSSGRVLVGLTSANTSGSNFQVSQGVTFPATQSASSDANTLDDYEEGTFTPTFTPGAGAFTTVSVTGAYTKIGRFVNVYMTLSITTVGTASGALTYSGLPFTNANSNRHVNLVRENGTTGLMGQTWIDPNATTGTVRRYDDASYTLASGQNYLLNLNYYTT